MLKVLWLCPHFFFPKFFSQLPSFSQSEDEVSRRFKISGTVILISVGGLLVDTNGTQKIPIPVSSSISNFRKVIPYTSGYN
jgi:hypothetical protein